MCLKNKIVYTSFTPQRNIIRKITMRKKVIDLNIQLEKKEGIPLYRQLCHAITKMVQDGVLKPKDKLPTERDLAQQLGAARGTVTKAYDNLAQNGIIEVIQGRGCFVGKNQDFVAEGEKDSAIKLIEDMFDQLEAKQMTPKEISNLFKLVAIEKELANSVVKVAIVDCNPEALSIFAKQLRYITKGHIDLFLFEEVYRYTRIANKLSDYDLIVTTDNHYQELLKFLPHLSRRITQVVISPSQQTIMDITNLRTTSKIGIIYQSKRFLEIVTNRLDSFQIKTNSLVTLQEKSVAKLKDFVEKLGVIIMPPNSTLKEDPEVMAILDEFKDNGGQILTLEYQIERGSLIYIEEQISRIKS